MLHLAFCVLALQVELGCSVARSATDPKDAISSSERDDAISHRKLVRRQKQQNGASGGSVVEMDSEGKLLSFLQESSYSSNVSEASEKQGLPRASPDQINGSDSNSLMIGPAGLPDEHVSRKKDSQNAVGVKDSVTQKPRMLVRRKSRQIVPMISTYSDSGCSDNSLVAQLLLPSVKGLSSSQCVLGAASMKVNTSNDSLDKQGWQDHPTSVKLECGESVASVLLFKAGDSVNSSCTELIGESTIAKEHAVKAHHGGCIPAVDKTTGKAVWFKFQSLEDSGALPECFHKHFPFLIVLLMVSMPLLVVLLWWSIRLYKARSRSRQSSMYDRFCAEQADKEVLQAQKFSPAEEAEKDEGGLQASPSESPPSRAGEEVAEQSQQLSTAEAEQPPHVSPTQKAAREEALREQQVATLGEPPLGQSWS
jgi:hypothetical protein